MKIVVIGGTGLIGAQLVAALRAQGHVAVGASPGTGVNAVTGDGLDAALTAADAVVDTSNSPSFDADAVMAFFATSARNLVAASLAAGVKHLVVLSVVGTDRLLDSAYFRAKLAQEEVVEHGAVPYTIVRATQFFEFALGIAHAAADGAAVRLPDALVQPIASRDVATALAEVAVSPARHSTFELAGPERMPLVEFVERALRARGDDRAVVVDSRARYFGAPLGTDSLVSGGGAQLATTRLDDWLREEMR